MTSQARCAVGIRISFVAIPPFPPFSLFRQLRGLHHQNKKRREREEPPPLWHSAGKEEGPNWTQTNDSKRKEKRK